MALWTKTDNDAGKPKYLSDALRNGQSVSDKDSTLGLNITEAQAATNIAKGLKTPGWTLYNTYTDSQGNTRNKAEVLVAMNTFGVDGSDNDTIAPEITITVQPSNETAIETETETFSVTATRTGTGTLTYQWQKSDNGTTWNNIVGANAASYTTGALTIADDNGDQYRVIVSLIGANAVTSNVATLTVTSALVITEQPIDVTVLNGDTASFTVDYTLSNENDTANIQWQVSTDGTTWTAITGGTNFDLEVLSTAPEYVDGNQFRAVITVNAQTFTSDAATLTVTAE